MLLAVLLYIASRSAYQSVTRSNYSSHSCVLFVVVGANDIFKFSLNISVSLDCCMGERVGGSHHTSHLGEGKPIVHYSSFNLYWYAMLA